MFRTVTTRKIGQLLAVTLAWCLWPTSAEAQVYPCSGQGPGPGERAVGSAPPPPNSPQGTPPLLLCTRDGGGMPAPYPSGPTNSHAAIGWHPDVADIWVDGNYINGAWAPKKEVVWMCNNMMGALAAGCEVATSWSNSSMTVFRDKEGYFYAGWNGEGGADRKRVLAECSAKQLLPCEVFATVRSSSGKKEPKPGARKLYAAAAAVKGRDGYDGKLYIVSGFQTASGVSAAAQKACSDMAKRPCETRALSGNGFIQAYRLNDNDDRATAETSAKRAKQAAELDCKQQRATCKLQASFDSRKPGLFVHDFATGYTHK